MTLSSRIRFFNFFRNIFRLPPLEHLLARLTRGGGYDDFFVKCLPQNYQYHKGSFRIAKRDGVRYRLDISEYMEWVIYFGLNVEERNGLYSLVKRGMVVFDIGTNIGETLLNFAAISGPAGRVFGFEPVEENFSKCRFNISLNDFNNIELSRMALSDKRERLYFVPASNSNSGGIFMHKDKQDAEMSIEAVTLDEYVDEHNIRSIDFIKIDVEGFELNVLKGAAESVRKFRPVLFVEVDADNLKRQGTTPHQLEELLTRYGYSIKVAGEKHLTAGNNLHYDLICEPLNK